MDLKHFADPSLNNGFSYAMRFEGDSEVGAIAAVHAVHVSQTIHDHGREATTPLDIALANIDPTRYPTVEIYMNTEDFGELLGKLGTYIGEVLENPLHAGITFEERQRRRNYTIRALQAMNWLDAELNRT